MKVLKWLDRHLEEVILVFLLCCIVAVMLYQIVCRYIFNNSLTWSEEFCRYCFIWFMFVGISYSTRFDLDLRVDAIIHLFPAKVKKGLQFVGLFICLAIVSWLFINSFETVAAVARTGERSAGLHVSMKYVYLASVIGYGLGTLRYIQCIIMRFMDGRRKEK